MKKKPLSKCKHLGILDFTKIFKVREYFQLNEYNVEGQTFSLDEEFYEGTPFSWICQCKDCDREWKAKTPEQFPQKIYDRYWDRVRE